MEVFMATNPLTELNKLGQSVWHDYIRRGEIVSGGLKRLIVEDGLTGVTSNPSIFEKAIAGSSDYDEAIQKYAQMGLSAPQIYERLAVEDIQYATDLFRPVYDSTHGRDGFVSIEVSPLLAHDTKATIEEARRLHKSVNRPNVLIKIPGTKEGLPAIEQALAEGININITLLFAVERYVEVAKIYVSALATRLKQAEPIDRIASVASFFVSRIDTLIDQQLEARLKTAEGDAERRNIENLLGKTAIANAKIAYQEFKNIFSEPKFKRLAEKGAKVQRVLWASTSTKNPKYSDVLYVDDLIGPDTVNTMPTATMTAFRDHGDPRVTIGEGLEEARLTFKQLGELGINLATATAKLEEDGCEAFARDYNKLVGVIEEKRKKLTQERTGTATTSVGPLEGAITATLSKLDQEQVPRRMWDRDPSVWKSEPDHRKIIKNALGWLSISQEMLEHKATVLTFVQEAKRTGFKSAVLLGMGGSSLCPEVCSATFGTAPGFLELHVLDSTVPANIARIEQAIDVAKTLFIVSSKSGGTAETLSFFKYFYERVKGAKQGNPGDNFIAITDPGTNLEKLAYSKGFRHVFPGKSDIGGRYSALSNFGMVPAALSGVDIGTLLERAEQMAQACGCCIPAKDNPGVSLGVVLAEAARAGRNKVTFVMSPAVASFGLWLEQLIAESTGKEGKGLIPVAGEALGDPGNYSADRLFVSVQLGFQADVETARKLKALEAVGHPVVRIELSDKLDLGQEFFRWEIATATVGSLLGIDAFDQPNVQESKDNTSRLLGEFKSKGKLPAETPMLEVNTLSFYCDAETQAALKGTGVLGTENPTAEGLLAAFLAQARPGDYAALMAYLEQSEEIDERLEEMRLGIRDRLRLATTVGFGPRFLHSTGQLHKGGPNAGLYLQLTSEDTQDLPVPGEPYTFSILKQAQALGDLQSLRAKKRRVMRVHLGKEAASGMDRLSAALAAALAKVRAKAA
jgi:transaldolase / glucose-6-phosphate isomerase